MRVLHAAQQESTLKYINNHQRYELHDLVRLQLPTAQLYAYK